MEMMNKVRHFFDRHIRSGGMATEAGHSLQVATAALLIEVMLSDGECKDAEHHAVLAAIQSRFALSADETASLLRLAESEARAATDYYQFTALIDRHFTADEKVQVVEQLWQVALADHEIDRFERTLVQKIADLLHVPRAAQIAARDRAVQRTTS